VLRYNYGVALCRAGRFTAAAGEFRKVIELEPAHARAWYNVAGLAQQAGAIGEAHRAWHRFIALAPRVASAWFNLGLTCMDFDRPVEAVWCFTQAVLLAPEDPDALVNLAAAHEAAGAEDLAERALAAALELSPCDGAVLRAAYDYHARRADNEAPDSERHRLLAELVDWQLAVLEQEAASRPSIAAAPNGEETWRRR
jgi:tetratricopeptide (TPR) repeat protein